MGKIWRCGRYVPEIDAKPVLSEIKPVFTQKEQDRLLGISNGLAGVSAMIPEMQGGTKGGKLSYVKGRAAKV